MLVGLYQPTTIGIAMLFMFQCLHFKTTVVTTLKPHIFIIAVA